MVRKIPTIGQDAPDFEVPTSDGKPFKLSDELSKQEYKIEGAGVSENKDAFVKVFVTLPEKNISDKERNKLSKILEEIYGEPGNKFKPGTPN